MRGSIRWMQFYVALSAAMISYDIIARCIRSQRLAHAPLLDAKGYFHDEGWGRDTRNIVPFRTILRRIACIPYITLNRLHYLRGLQNAAEAPCLRDSLSARNLFPCVRQPVYTGILFSAAFSKENRICRQNVNVTKYRRIYLCKKTSLLFLSIIGKICR